MKKIALIKTALLASALYVAPSFAPEPTEQDIAFLQQEIDKVFVDPIHTINFFTEGVNAPVRNIQNNQPTGDNALTELFHWLAQPEEQLLKPIELLLAYGININHQAAPHGETALYLACLKNPPSLTIVQKLMTAKPDTTADKFGRTPLNAIQQQMQRYPQYTETYLKIIKLLKSSQQ